MRAAYDKPIGVCAARSNECDRLWRWSPRKRRFERSRARRLLLGTKASRRLASRARAGWAAGRSRGEQCRCDTGDGGKRGETRTSPSRSRPFDGVSFGKGGETGAHEVSLAGGRSSGLEQKAPPHLGQRMTSMPVSRISSSRQLSSVRAGAAGGVELADAAESGWASSSFRAV